MALNYDILNTVSSYMQTKDLEQVETLCNMFGIPTEAVPDLLLKKSEVIYIKNFMYADIAVISSDLWEKLCDLFTDVQKSLNIHRTLMQLKRYIVMRFRELRGCKVDPFQLRYAYFYGYSKLSKHKELLLEFVRLTLVEYFEELAKK